MMPAAHPGGGLVRALAASLAFAGALLFGAPGPLYADVTQETRQVDFTGVEGTDARGISFARLVFEAGAVRPYNIGIDGNQVILLFERPVGGNLKPIVRALQTHVVSARVSAHGRIVALKLRGEYRTGQTTVDGALLVDLIPLKAPAKPPVRTAKRKAKKVPPQVSATTSDMIWKKAIERAISGSPSKKPLPKVTMMPKLPRAAREAQTKARAPLKQKVADANRKPGDAGAKVAAGAAAADALAGIEPAAGGSITIDLPPAGKTDGALKPEEGKAAESRAPAKMVPEKKDVANSGTASGSGVTIPLEPVEKPKARLVEPAGTLEMKPVAKAAPETLPKGIPRVESRKSAPPPAEPPQSVPPRSLPTKSEPPKAMPSEGPPPDGPIRVRFAREHGAAAFSLFFDWNRATPAAVFRRSDFLWIVFGERAEMDFNAAQADGRPIAESLEVIKTASGTVVRLALDRPFTPFVRQNGHVWEVAMMRGQADPIRPMRVLTETGSDGGGKVVVYSGPASPPVRIPDAENGGDLMVVPVTTESSGVISDRDYPEFRILATAQGVAFRVQSKKLQIANTADGIAISADGGLQVSRNGGDGNGPVRPLPAATPIFQYATWRKGGTERFNEIKQQLQAAVATAKEDAQGARRLDLARFYFSYGLATEALGALNLIDPRDPVALDPSFSVLRGAAAVMANSMKDAEQDLFPSRLDGHPELALWRGSLRAYQGDWAGANRQFSLAGDLFRTYAEPYRTRFILQAAEAAINVRDHVQATRYLALIDESELSRPDKIRLALLRGQVQKAEGAVKDALKSWAEVIDSREGRSRVLAVLARIDLLTGQGKMSSGEAIEVLERLRFTWRGDDLEFETLRRLGRYYTLERKHKLALLSWRRAVTFYPDHADAPALRQKMQDTFTALFRDGMADELPPLVAVALFEEFRELVPATADGARMVRDFAERLVTVDLLNRAGDLLEKQIPLDAGSATGALVGARVAEIRMKDGQPIRALSALDKSRADGLAKPLADRRRYLRVSALTASGKSGKALELLSGDTTRKANVLRADIHWRKQDWKQAAFAFGMIAAGIEPEGGEPLPEGEAQLVLGWAAALALSDDRRGLQALRRRFDAVMEAGPHKDTYRIFAAAITGPVTDYEAVITRLREVDHFEAFLETYRKESEKAAKETAAGAAATPPPAAGAKPGGQQARVTN